MVNVFEACQSSASENTAEATSSAKKSEKTFAVEKVTKKIIIKKTASKKRASLKVAVKEAITPAADPTSNERSFVCKHCHEAYTSSHQLGGHTSRKHPGSSEDYKKKLEIRDSREPDREALKQAKE